MGVRRIAARRRGPPHAEPEPAASRARPRPRPHGRPSIGAEAGDDENDPRSVRSRFEGRMVPDAEPPRRSRLG